MTVFVVVWYEWNSWKSFRSLNVRSFSTREKADEFLTKHPEYQEETWFADVFESTLDDADSEESENDEQEL